MKKNNKGITLIELVITVTILALIVAPLLRAFVVSAQTNAKAKERLRSTDLAENIMEDIEAYGLEEISKQVNSKQFILYGDNDADKVSNSCELNKAKDAIDYTVATTVSTKSEYDWVAAGDKPATSSSILVDATTNTYEFRETQNEDKSYYFALGGIESDGKTYDALITISEAAKSSAALAGTVNDVNNASLAEITSIGSDTSRVVQYGYSDSEDDRKVIEEKHAAILDADNNVISGYDNYVTYIQRTITVTLGGDDEVTKVNVDCSLDLVKNCKTSQGDTKLLERTLFQFDSAGDDEGHIEDLFLMLYPWYNGNLEVPDNIVVVNPNNLDTNIIVAKQSKDASDMRSYADDIRYAMCFQNIEKAESNGNMSSKTHAVFRTMIDGCSSSAWKRYKYLGETLDPLIYSYAETEMTSDLIDKSSHGRIYDVTINIYSAGTLFKNDKYVTDFNDDEKAYCTFTGGLVY